MLLSRLEWGLDPSLSVRSIGQMPVRGHCTLGGKPITGHPCSFVPGYEFVGIGDRWEKCHGETGCMGDGWSQLSVVVAVQGKALPVWLVVGKACGY